MPPEGQFQNRSLPSPPLLSLPFPPFLTSALVKGWVILPGGYSITDLGGGALWATFSSFGYKMQPRNRVLLGWKVFRPYTTQESTSVETTSVFPNFCAPSNQKSDRMTQGRTPRSGLNVVRKQECSSGQHLQEKEALLGHPGNISLPGSVSLLLSRQTIL